MYLESLKIKNFRNLLPQTINFCDKVTLLCGRNAQGKTSFLEAVYLLSHSKSFRESRISEVVSWNSSSEEINTSEVVGNIKTNDGRKKISYIIENGRRKVFLNENSVKQASEFYGQCTVVDFIPDDLQLVKGSPSERRQYLDKTIAMVDRDYVNYLVNYQRALKQRNAEIKNLIKTKNRNTDSLFPWTVSLIDNGLKLVKKRRETLTILEKKIPLFYEKLKKENSIDDDIEIFYQSSYLKDQNAFITKEELLEKYSESTTEDLRCGSTRFGPHRDDIEIIHRRKKNAKVSASQGQTRSIALSFKISSSEYIKETLGESPILILDDVESELDYDRKKRLFEILKNEIDSQILITSTEVSDAFLEVFKGANKIYIEGGEVKL